MRVEDTYELFCGECLKLVELPVRAVSDGRISCKCGAVHAIGWPGEYDGSAQPDGAVIDI